MNFLRKQNWMRGAILAGNDVAAINGRYQELIRSGEWFLAVAAGPSSDVFQVTLGGPPLPLRQGDLQ